MADTTTTECELDSQDEIGSSKENNEKQKIDNTDDEEDFQASAGPSIVEQDISELERAVERLLQSNEELAEFLSGNGPDAELTAAIEDNIIAIQVKRTRIADLRELKSKGIFPTFLSSDPGKERTAVTVTYPSGQRLTNALEREKEREEAERVARALDDEAREAATGKSASAATPNLLVDPESLGIML
jgi:hypothetical protein